MPKGDILKSSVDDRPGGLWLVQDVARSFGLKVVTALLMLLGCLGCGLSGASVVITAQA